MVLVFPSLIKTKRRTPVGRCGRRVLCAVQGSVGHAFCACSIDPARSTGCRAVSATVGCPIRDDRQIARPVASPCERRLASHCSPLEAEDPFPFTLRRDGPVRASRCARWTTRSRIASASVGSPIDLLFVLMNLFQAIRMAGKFIQFIMQLFFQRNIDLVSSFANDRNQIHRYYLFCSLFHPGFLFQHY